MIANDPWLKAMETLYNREYVEALTWDVDAGKLDNDEPSSEKTTHN